MAVTKYLYKDTATGVFLCDGNALSTGDYNLMFYSSDTIVSLVNVSNEETILDCIEITNLLKESGDPYTSKAELVTALIDLFSNGVNTIASTINSLATTNITTTNLQSDKEQIDLKAITYKPATQPVITAGTLTLNCANYYNCKFESRTSTGTRLISGNFTYAFSNAANTDFICDILRITGGIVITFPSDVVCSNASQKGTWNTTAHTLTLAGLTDNIIEVHLMWDASDSLWLLKVSEVNV